MSSRRDYGDKAPFGNINLDDISILPITHRLGDEICFVAGTEEDPPIYICTEVAEDYKLLDKHYTVFTREVVIEVIEQAFRQQEVYARVKHKNNPLYTITSEKYRKIHNEIRDYHKEFVNKIYIEDEAGGQFTLIPELQKRWVEEFSETDLWKVFRSHGFKKMPYTAFIS